MSLLGTSKGGMQVFTDAAVDDRVEMTLHAGDEKTISIFFDEWVRLEFFDVASLERLRDLAEQGARRLRAAGE